MLDGAAGVVVATAGVRSVTEMVAISESTEHPNELHARTLYS